ncbi:MAG: efflux RND transporter permease subunit [Pseudomonadota bacterium]|nr:efflux RND transporter permease subunit [Pseudomonadota bacterium]
MAGPADTPPGVAPAGLISRFVRHPTATNLLMAVMIVLGLFSLSKLNTQFFPTVEIPRITVSVTWPGASASDVEKNILDALEPELRFLDDVDEVTSVAREGGGVISIDFNAGADMQQALSDVEQAVKGVTTLPEDSEEPVIKRIQFFERVATLVVAGPYSEQDLNTYAKHLRDGLLAAGIDKVTMSGARDEEIWIRIREADLRRLDLTLSDIATRVREETRDLPAGIIEGSIEMQLRALAERRTPETLGEIEVKALTGGQKVHLRDIARIETRFDREQAVGRHEGQLSIELDVQRALSADTLKTMEIMDRYLAEALPKLPGDLIVEKIDVRGKFVAQRLGILITNGIQGLVLVLVVLFIFLDARIAFWVAAGIPVALLAALSVMWASGQTINMVSMFALIMMLGIIVDDAIVVGEETATRQQMGASRLESAEHGAHRMLAPVFAATLTTQAAFFPLFLIRDRIGDILSAIPLVVIAVLFASLIECFLILPGHLRHGFGKINRTPNRYRAAFDGALSRFRDGPFSRIVSATYDWRYTTIAATIGALIVCFGLIAGGRIGFTFFPSPESENISASVTFVAGTPREEQQQALDKLVTALRKVEADLSKGKGGLVESANSKIGSSSGSRGDNVAQISVQLAPSEDRDIRTVEIINAWRRALPRVVGMERVAILGQRAGPPGRDVDIRLQNAPVEDLKAAALELRDALTAFPGISGIDDDLPYGKPELILELTPRGSALGFTAQSVGTQVRNAFEGAIATRFPRGDEEITVRVKNFQDVPGPLALRELYLRAPSGQRVPLTEVVSVREKAGFSVIQRRDGARTVAVTADLDSEQISLSGVVEKLSATTLPALAQKYNLDWTFKGREEERAKSFADLKLGSLLALVLIYIILAWVFESYALPLAVMAIIPFGMVGAMLGHLLMGFKLTIVSMIGLLGLSGILVNDSIILVSQVVNRIRAGDLLRDAAIGAARDRLRAVLLTSLTTIGGLAPLLFETSRQAQFLIPMAVTLVFGLLGATILVLILVPSMVGIGGDLAALRDKALARLRRGGGTVPAE